MLWPLPWQPIGQKACTVLSSLRKTRESWENQHNRPARSPQLGSPSDVLPAAAKHSDRTGVKSSDTPDVEQIERWLKDVSAALERENGTIKDARTQQVVRRDSVRENAGSPLRKSEPDAYSVTCPVKLSTVATSKEAPLS